MSERIKMVNRGPEMTEEQARQFVQESKETREKVTKAIEALMPGRSFLVFVEDNRCAGKTVLMCMNGGVQSTHQFYQFWQKASKMLEDKVAYGPSCPCGEDHSL